MSIEEQLRQDLNTAANSLAVPDAIDAEVRNTYRTYLKQKGKMTMARKMTYATVASVVLCAGIFTTGFVSPAMAEVLSNVPLVGSVFQKQKTADDGLRAASKDGFATEINKSVTDQGVTVTLTEMINDGVRLSMAAVFEFPKGVYASQGVLGFTYTLPDQGEIRIARNGMKWKWSSLGGNKYSAIAEFPIETLPEEYTMHMTFDEIGSVKGKWAFDVPISRKAENLGTSTVEVNQAQRLNETTDIKLKQVKLAPSATSLEFSMQGPEVEKWVVNKVGSVSVHHTPRVMIYDDKGNLLREITQYIHNNASDQIDAEFVVNPLKHRTEFLHVKMQEYYLNFDPAKDYKTTLEFKVPLPQAEKK